MRARTAALALLFVAVAASPLCAGSARALPALVLAGLGALALVCTLLARAAAPLPPAPLALPLAMAAILAVAQLVPLPPSLQMAIDPAEARVHARVLKGLVASGVWMPLTHDAAATLLAATRLAGLMSLALALAWAVRAGARKLLVTALAVGLAAAAAAPVASIAGVDLPLPAPHRALVLSFANANHAAALCALLLPLVLTATAERRGHPAWLALAVAGNLLLVGTLSRAGIALGLAAQAVALVCSARDGVSKRGVAAAGAAVSLALVGALAAGAPVLARYSSLAAATQAGHVDRLAIARDAWRLVADHPLSGVGAGSFGIAFPRVSLLSGRMHVAFAEDEYLQVVAERGLVGAALLAVALVIAIVAAWRWRRATSLGRAAAIGLAAVAAHNVIDFSWESGAVAVASCAVAALVSRPRGSLPAPVGWSVVGGTGVLLLLAASPIGTSAEQDEARAAAALVDDPSRAPSVIAGAFRRHPDDALLADTAADALFRARSAEGLTWIERALVLRPHDPLAHILAARAFALCGRRAQAADELAAAFADEPSFYIPELATTAVEILGSDAALLARAASTPAATRAIAARLGAEERWPALLAVATHGLTLAPDDVALAQYAVEAALALGPDALRSAPVARVAADAERAPWSALLAARALFALGHRIDASELLARAAARAGDAQVAAQLAAWTADDPERARAVLEQAAAHAQGPEEAAVITRALARLDERSGRPHRARVEGARALRLAGESP